MLSEIGFAHAKSMGEEKEISKSGIKAYISPFKRTADTAEQIIKGIQEKNEKTKIFKSQIREELAPPMWRNFEKLREELKKVEEKEGHDGLVRYLLSSTGETKEDLEDWTNAFGHLVNRYIKMSHKFYNHSDIELMHLAHEPLLSSFLKSVIILRDQEGNKVSFDNIDQIGGPFQPGENFDIEFSRDDKGQEHLSIKVRGKTYEVDREKIKEMAEKNKLRAYKGRVIKQDYKEK